MNFDRYTFAPTEKLFFMHIPKTAGTSFFEILTTYFGKGLYGPDASYTDLSQAHREFDPQQVAQKAAVAGHWDMGIMEQAHPWRLVPITLVRHPIERIVSHYHYIKNTLDPHNEYLHTAIHRYKLDITGWINFAPLHPDIWNPQASQVAGVKWSQPALLGDEVQVLARMQENWQRLALVGLTERFPETLLLLAFRFGWQAAETIPRLKVGEIDTKTFGLSDVTLEAIQQVTGLDTVLYEMAKNTYNHGLTQLIRQVLELENLPMPDPAEEQLYAKKLFYPALYTRLRDHLNQQLLESIG